MALTKVTFSMIEGMVVNVMDYGATCDGVTDDWAAIEAAQEYLKANGGGTLYFPGWCAIYNTFYFYGAVTGQWSNPYPVPTPPRITWASDGTGGIKSFITSGDVLRFSSPSATLTYAPCFKDFAIDCTAKNVTAINGTAQAGIYGANHYTDIDGLIIHGLTGADAVGVNFGTITDSTVRALVCQAYSTQARAGVIINKANVQLFACRFSYFNYGIEVGELAEAGIYMFGGHILSSKLYSIYWNNTGADFKSSASTLSGVFIGEQTVGGEVLGAADAPNLDISTITFQGCVFDNYRVGDDLIDIAFGGKFNFIGCDNYSLSPGLNSIKFGQYCYVNMLNNHNITVNPASAAVYNGQVNELPFATNVAFTPALSASGSTFNYATNGQSGFYSKVGRQVTVTIRLFLATSGNTLTSSALRITGLPFPVSTNVYSRSVSDIMWFGSTTPLVNAYGLALENGTSIDLYAITAATTSAGGTTLKANDLNATSGAGLTLTFSYFTDD
jgi:hypothetical protein